VSSGGQKSLSLDTAGRQRLVVGAGGLRLQCDALIQDVQKSDLVLVPPLDPDVLEHLALRRAVVPWLRRFFLSGASVASACTGAFLVAEAGLLDGRAATTHWAFQELFRHRYPQVRLEPEAIIVDQGRIVTAGGATSFLALALYLVERLLGSEGALRAGRRRRSGTGKPCCWTGSQRTRIRP
jgi:transcriptional regulator GlxA family with amidase domain